MEGDLLTPARDHLIFPDTSGPRRTRSHGLVQLKADVSSRVTEHRHHEGLFDRLGFDASKKPKKNFGLSDYTQKRKMESTVAKLSKEDGPFASAEDDKADEDLEQR